MKKPKLVKKLLAGILCVGMLAQSIPIDAVANETGQISMEAESMEAESMEAKESTDAFTETVQEETETLISELQTNVPEEVTDELSETETDRTQISETETDQTQISETETISEETSNEEISEEISEDIQTWETESVETEEIETESVEAEEEITELEEAENQETQEEDVVDYTTLRMATENTYYYYGKNLYIILKLSGCEISDDVIMTFSIDGKECGENAAEPFGKIYKDEKQEGYYIISFKKGDLEDTSSETHNLLLTLSKMSGSGNIRELVTREAVFSVTEQDIFLEKTPYYMGVSDENVEVTIFNTADDIETMMLSNNGETVAAPAEGTMPEKELIKNDPRYIGICSDYEFPEEILKTQNNVLLYKSVWVLSNLKNAIDLGSYNINLIFDNGETMDLANAVTITSDAVVTNCTVAVDYDNTSPYAYLFIQGSGFDPAEITYNFKLGSSTGSPLSSTRVSCKEVWSGYIVKFQKIGNWPKAGENIYVSLRGNNIRFSKNEFISEVQSGIYYAEYNPVLKAVEVGVTVDLTGKRTQFCIVSSEDDVNGNPATVNSLTESLIYLTPQNSLSAGVQYVRLVVDGKNYPLKEFTVDATVLDTDRWDAPKVISKNAERHYFYYYYEEAGITSSDLSAKITGENGTIRDAVVSASEWIREDAGKGTNIKVVIPTQKLEVGKYVVELFKTLKGVTTLIATYDFEIVASNNSKFILEEYSVSWINDDVMQVYIKTPNCSEDDDFDIKLTETSGREVEDLKTVITNRYSDSIYMEVTGLKRTKAFRDYYVLLTHKNKDYEANGYPFTMSDMTKQYYAEAQRDKGELKTISFNRGMPIKVTANNRVIGINLQYMALPATIKFYAPNDTTELTDLTITASTEDDYYYFTKEFYDSLPNKDTMYDMVVSDADGWGRVYSGVTIGYWNQNVQNDFKIKITTDILFLGVEDEDTAYITVTGNIQIPTFESSDESIVTVEADADDTNKAVVKAAEKTGTTVVTVFADGVEKSIIITVTSKVDAIALNTSGRKMNVGDTFNVEVFTLPSGSEDATHKMTFTSSDESILYVKQLTATTAKITAMSSGTAILRASLNGTTHVTSMSVSVTGLFSLTEKKTKISDAGISSYIENVDRSLEYCELPEGWKWDDPSISPSASDDVPVQYYGATYTQDGYESFSTRLPVAVTRITGINIEGKNLVNRGKKEEYSVTYEYVGRDIGKEEIDRRLSVNCVKAMDTEIANVVSTDKSKVVIETIEKTDGGTAEFYFTLSIDKGTIEGSDMLSKTFKVTVPAEDCVDNIVLTPLRTGDQSFTFRPESRRLEIDVNEIKKANGKYTVSIGIEATINDIPAKNIKFEWKSDDEQIASFTKDKETGNPITDKNGNVVLTIKNVGIVQITATAKDAGAFVGSMTVHVMDYEPVLETNTITVNKNNTAGVEFSLQEQNGNTLKMVRVLEQDTESKNFAVKLKSNGTALMYIKDGAPAKSYHKKTKSSAVLEIETVKGGRYQYPVTIVTEVAVPTATIKLQKKANLFYKDASAVYTVSSNYEIESVKDVGSQAYKERFYGVYNKNSSIITFTTKGTLNSTTAGLFTAPKSSRLETRLQINFTGYSEPQYIDVKVAVDNKKPNLTLTSLMTCPGIQTGAVSVLDTKTKEKFVLSNSKMKADMSVVSAGVSAPSINSAGGIDISYYGNKNTSYAISLTSDDWTQAIELKGKIKYLKSPELLVPELGNKQVTLNLATNIEDNGAVTVPISVGGNNIRITDIEYAGNAKELIENKLLSYEFDVKKQVIKIGLIKDSQSAVRAGNYKLDLYASIVVGENSVKIKKTTLGIKCTDEKAAKVTFSSPKGKINLVERSNTSVVYTPKISGMDSDIRSVSVTGDNQKLFTATLNQDNKVEIKARTGVAMTAKTTYNVTILTTLENNYQIETVLKIKPVNKLPNIVLNSNTGVLYRSNSNKYVAKLSFKNSSLNLNRISGIALDMTKKDAQLFSLSSDINRNGTISFALAGDRTNVPKGNYKLTCLVSFKDADMNAKPVAVSVNITVK